MAKKKNEILEEQRRARQSFMDLKRMQNGEISPQPKPSEQVVLPQTFSEKFANFWYHYKYVVIVTAAFAIIFSVLFSQCIAKEKYDFEVVFYTYQGISDDKVLKLEEYFEQFGSDVDGDGKTNIDVINCSFTQNPINQQYIYTMQAKLLSIISSNEKAILFVLDDKSYEYLCGMSNESVFDSEPILLGDDFYKLVNTENEKLPSGLKLCCRRVKGTTIEDNKNSQVIHDEAMKVLQKIKENSKSK